MAKVTVHFNDGSTEAREVAGEQFLLTELEDQGVKIARGCFAGSCGVCRMEIIHGADNISTPDIVEQDTIDHLRDTEGGEFRLACTVKVTGDIEVKAERYIDLKI